MEGNDMLGAVLVCIVTQLHNRHGLLEKVDAGNLVLT